VAAGAGVQLTLKTVVLITSTAMSRGAAVGTGEQKEEGQENRRTANSRIPLKQLFNNTIYSCKERK